MDQGIVGRGACKSRDEGRGLWVRGRGGYEGNRNFVVFESLIITAQRHKLKVSMVTSF